MADPYYQNPVASSNWRLPKPKQTSTWDPTEYLSTNDTTDYSDMMGDSLNSNIPTINSPGTPSVNNAQGIFQAGVQQPIMQPGTGVGGAVSYNGVMLDPTTGQAIQGADYGLAQGENFGGSLGDLLNFSGRQAGTQFYDGSGNLMQEGTFFDTKLADAQGNYTAAGKSVLGKNNAKNNGTNWAAWAALGANLYGMHKADKQANAALDLQRQQLAQHKTEYNDTRNDIAAEKARRGKMSDAMHNGVKNSGLYQHFVNMSNR